MHNQNVVILAIDDDEQDQQLITLAFRKNGVTCQIEWANHGEEAIAYLNGAGKFADRARYPYPSFVMTDLKMSPGDGFDVLQHLKKRPEWAVLPVVVFSASCDADDIKRSYMLGAGSYIRKPNDFEELQRLLKVFYDYWIECELPATDASGKRLPTRSEGKLGARFDNQDDNEEAP